MFKEQYQKDNEKIVADEALKKYIKAKMSEATPEKHSRFPRAVRVLAPAVCVCLVLAAVLIPLSKLRAVAPTVVPTAQVGQMTQGASYDEIFTSISEVLANRNDYYDEEQTTGAVAVNDGMKLYNAEPSETAKPDYSTTNNQVDGVDEADLVKTDGQYIYTLYNNRLSIAEAVDGKLTNVSSITLFTNDQKSERWMDATEFFLSGDKLIVYGNEYGNQSNQTLILIYGITDRAHPTLITTLTQSGWYSTSRMIGKVVYTLSNQTIYDRDTIKKNDPSTYVPTYGVDEETTAFEPACISVIDDFASTTYLVVTAIDLNTAAFTDTKAVLGGAENVYCNEHNLIFTYYYHDAAAEANQSNIVRLSLDDGKIETAATGVIDGSPLNQFSIDEYGGYIRVVTTKYTYTYTTYADDTIVSDRAFFTAQDSTNGLYVLDGDLKVVGSIENLAEGERVYSVRFDGNIGYFVTFRQVDPLFTVDLTDPTAPKMLGELKIPGFSDYLHIWEDGRLFGFGRSATEEGRVNGLKLSMFDVSDPSDVREESVLTLGNDAYSQANYNHKAIMVNREKNVIAFVATSYDATFTCNLYVYGYSPEEGFVERNVTPLSDKSYYNARFVYIGDYFYLIGEGRILSFSMDGFAKVDEVRF